MLSRLHRGTILVTMDIATLIASLFGLAGVIVAIWTIQKNSDLHRRQMNAEVFIKYAERYEQIMSCFPEDAFRARFSMSEELPPSSPQLTLAVLRYLNLSSEEFIFGRTSMLTTRCGRFGNMNSSEFSNLRS